MVPSNLILQEKKMTTLTRRGPRFGQVPVTFIVLTLIVYPSILKAAEPNSFPICKWTGEQSYPAVSGNYVVWQDKRSGGYDIYRNKPTDTNDVNGVPVCVQGGDQKFPAISGNTVVWQDARISASNTDVFRYTLPSGPEAAVCSYTGRQELPAISGSVVVWRDSRNGNNDIFGYNVSEFEICTDTAAQTSPAVSGNMAVWQDARNGNLDIYRRNISTGQEFEVCVSSSGKQNAAISGNIVVWQDNRNGDNDIYGKDLVTGQEMEICKYAGEQISPAISGDIVVWEDQRGSSSDIYGYRISTQTVFPICTLADEQKNPAIDGSFVVWEDYRNGSSNPDIYGAYIPEPGAPSTITVLDPNGSEMLLSGSKYTIRWQSSRLGGSNVKLEYSTNNGVGYSVIDANLPDSGSYLWQPLPIVDSNQCLIKISDKAGTIASDTSNFCFTIFECDASLTADLNGDCKVDFADFAFLGDQWLACGNPHDPNWCP
jgi:TolB protein